MFTQEQNDSSHFEYRVNDELCKISCTAHEVEKYPKALNIHKSPGPDKISPHILKECASQLPTLLCKIFNKSFFSGLLPEDWKIANIIPIYKKGHKHQKQNYRQISLTSIICKVAEKIIRSKISAFWLHHQVLNEKQFGYLRGKSTLAQLLSCFNDWAVSRNNSKATDAIFLDLAKAFDSVPHERLLLKLNRYGIGGPLLLWLRNFLTNRRQRVVIRGTHSDWSPVISGVPQGTFSGPEVVKSNIKLFADDTKIYRELTNPNDTTILQSDLDSLDRWATDWQVIFNTKKYEVMRRTKPQHKKDKTEHSYYLSNTLLKSVNSYKDLGVNMSSNLTWSYHVDLTVNKANKV